MKFLNQPCIANDMFILLQVGNNRDFEILKIKTTKCNFHLLVACRCNLNFIMERVKVLVKVYINSFSVV